MAPAKAGPVVPHTPVLVLHFIPVTDPVIAYAVTMAHGAFAQNFSANSFSPPDLNLLHSVFRI
jgi:hypothetical protein